MADHSRRSSFGQQFYSPPGTLKTVDTKELRLWANEVDNARDITLGHHSSWRRRQAPSWVRPGPMAPKESTRTIKALKRSFWHRELYERTLRIRQNEHGPFEIATLDPKSGKVTNTWQPHELLDVLVYSERVYVSLPGGMFRAKTFLHFDMASAAAASALVAEWGWEEEAEGDENGQAPVLTDAGDVFVFQH
eukprot:CAMPEP_0174729356 /NCGR_PEP_ID=MMETSP1094-20130205/53550_1 /TAXON_ID=156173 /ORGANISM="Chrysochromulina brevifilum, Strain UTEX LB 985" /LENGTH=191 /DNA_ID=CAMNT_0015931455 /DNA_START=12 /DNA_END=587 /DNA_ORIENTATION=-